VTLKSGATPAPTRQRHRARRIAWLLLAVVSFCVTYVLLVAGG
jgi:hypothetical protein